MNDIQISANDVAELRRETGAGMMDCKRALQESGGDKQKALEYLRKKGKAAAEKRADRTAEQGIVICRISADGTTGSMVEINSETDFVARNELFRKYGEELADMVLAWSDADGKSLDDLKAKRLPSGATVADALSDLTGLIGEKLAIGRFARLHVPGGFIGHYVHSDAKQGVLVALEGISKESPDALTLGRDLAMQVVGAKAAFTHRDEIPKDKIESELTIEKDRARNEGKPEPAIAKIAEGRVNKWISEVVLLEQPFVKDPKVIVKDLVAEVAKKSGKTIQVRSFVHFAVGA